MFVKDVEPRLGPRSRLRGCGGEGGIRTHGRLAPTPVFKTGALNHSATSPALRFQRISPTAGANSLATRDRLDPSQCCASKPKIEREPDCSFRRLPSRGSRAPAVEIACL